MTDLLITVLLVGCAVTYLIELLDLTIIGAWLSKSTINAFFTLPLSFGGMFVMTNTLAWQMLVTVPATVFISLALSKYVNKPVIVGGSRQIPRL